jgi:TPR repeat protein
LRRVLARACISLLAAIAIAAAAGCHRSGGGESSGSGNQSNGTPSDLRKIAAGAIKKARQWHPDAIMVSLEIENSSGQAQITMEFVSPSDLTGYTVTEGIGPESDQPAGSVNWGTEPIPADFLDYPNAVAAMRSRGMKGLATGGTLTAVKLCGVVPVMQWLITPGSEISIPGGYVVYAWGSPQSARPMDWRTANHLLERIQKGDANALDKLKAAAAIGDPNGATDYGYVLAVGAPNVPKDIAGAAPWFCAAAYEGNPAAQFNLGLMSERGWGLPQQDVSSATALYSYAAAQGLADAQLNLGALCFKHGCSALLPNGSNEERTRIAREQFEKAAAQGIAAATQNLAKVNAHAAEAPGRFTPLELVPLEESAAFVPASNWNPKESGIIPLSLVPFPERVWPANWLPSE